MRYHYWKLIINWSNVCFLTSLSVPILFPFWWMQLFFLHFSFVHFLFIWLFIYFFLFLSSSVEELNIACENGNYFGSKSFSFFLLVGLRIRLSYLLQKSNNPHQVGVSWVGHWFVSGGEDSVLKFWGMLTVPSLPLFPSPHWPGVIVPLVCELFLSERNT